MSDFLAKMAAEILLKVLILLIERIAHSDLASDVSHAIQERVDRKGIWSGVSSAIQAAVVAISIRVCCAWQAVVVALKQQARASSWFGKVHRQQIAVSVGSASLALRAAGFEAKVIDSEGRIVHEISQDGPPQEEDTPSPEGPFLA